MIVLAFLIILTILAFFADKFIRKHNVKIYIVATIISILAFILQDKAFTTPIMQGFLGLSFFYIVMITGAIDKKYKIKAKFLGLRREYSIIGFIVIAPHALKYTLQGLNGTIALEWFGMTSFLKIRRKMKAKTWNSIQSAAYIIYILLFIHLILNYTLKINLILYLVIFIFYFVMKMIYEIKKYDAKKKKKLASSAA